MTEHKAAVRRGDRNNGIAIHAWDDDHRIARLGRCKHQGGATAIVEEEGTGGSTHPHAA